MFPQEEFLRALEDLQPDLCITAAYGCMLPQRFLSIPPLGTINIHPSLLPKCVAKHELIGARGHRARPRRPLCEHLL